MLNRYKERSSVLISKLNIKYKRYIHNYINTKDRLIGVVGPRGCGKTTYLLQYLKELPIETEKKLYISADFINIVSDSLFDIAETFSQQGGKVLVIDEIHKYPNFEIELKNIYDFLDIKVFFSGSSAISLEHSKADLSRRAVIYRINGLSFREFLELETGQEFNTYSLNEILNNHVEISLKIINKIKPFEFFSKYLTCGFYPFYLDNKDTYLNKLEEIINIVIESDLPIIFNIEPKNIFKLKKLIKLICSSPPYELNISKLSQKTEIDRNTLYQYIHYLQAGSIFLMLKPKSKGYNIFSKPEKLYLNNTNLYYCFCYNYQIGTIRETFFINQLKYLYDVEYPAKGDIIVEEKYSFEIGGKNKTYNQIKDIENSYLAIDNIEVGNENKIPLWLFGFLY